MMKKMLGIMMVGLILACGYNLATKQGCTHVHNDQCGYENGQCAHTYHQEKMIMPMIDRGGEF